jgi:hypothetical protein
MEKIMGALLGRNGGRSSSKLGENLLALPYVALLTIAETEE